MSTPSTTGSATPAAGGGAPPAQGNEPPPRDDAGAGDEDELDSSFFPSPAHYYKRYTTANLALPLSHVEPLFVSQSTQPGDVEGKEKEKDGNAGVSFTRKDLEPPNPDWVVERGNYAVFGETWPVVERLPSLQELGVREMFSKADDRNTSLQTLLQALLLSYTSLINSLLAPPPSLVAQPDTMEPLPPTEPERLVEHIRLISVNMHHLVNELRPVQARETLKNMMRAQIETRRAKTAAMKLKCAELSATLASLKLDLVSASASVAPTTGTTLSSDTLSKKYSSDGSATKEKEFERLRAAVDALDV
ncbi:hypothetical protein T439DRAFT_381370 [Meredithblackwellia eburnea MCA 4105]